MTAPRITFERANDGLIGAMRREHGLRFSMIGGHAYIFGLSKGHPANNAIAERKHQISAEIETEDLIHRMQASARLQVPRVRVA